VRYRSKGPQPTFLACADLQGREADARQNRLLGESAADEIKSLQELGVLPQLDLCLLCGDFYDYPDLRKLGGTGDVTAALNALSSTAWQTFAVLGNHDEVNVGQLVADVRILDGKIARPGSFTLGGVCGIIGNPAKNQRKTDEEFLAALQYATGSQTNVLLLHQGPQGASAHPPVFDPVHDYLQTRKELLVLFGHKHWDEPFHAAGQNLYCNVHERIVVFVPE
jgi:Icc-related predicted phosphoesterase